ncbi:MAG: hypothetical protein IPJ32_18360 [Sphingobacteriaceae bacterium]|nr:hypothetical protein [Sphingobacteriaceae bacterium]
MALSIKELIEKNKNAYKHQYYIESVNLSYGLITKALKQIISEEKISTGAARMKLSDCIKIFKQHYTTSPIFKKKLKKTVYKNICEFNADYKLLSKELKYQYPELKLKHASKRGIEIMVNLNTSLIKIRSNR